MGDLLVHRLSTSRRQPMSTGKETMWERFSAWLIMEPTTPAQTKAYVGLMMVAYIAVFLLSVIGLIQAALIACWATGIMDVLLFLSGKVRAKLPLAIPLGLVGMLGIALHAMH